MTRADALFIASHCNNVYLGKFKGPLSGEVLDRFEYDHINGYSFVMNGVRYIFIAGTDGWRDVLTDAKFFPSHFGGEPKRVKVHTGFENAYDLVKSHIFGLKVGPKGVVIAGHSMGGAIATLLAYKMADAHPNVHCVTFGSPRVGNGAFAKEFKARVPNSCRVVHRNDAVTRHPFPIWGFRHVGELYQSKRKRWFSVFTALFDHSMQEYVDGIGEGMWEF